MASLKAVVKMIEVEDGGVVNKMMVNVMRKPMWMVMLKKMLRKMMRKPKFCKR